MPVPEGHVEERTIRRMKLSRQDHGYTKGCQGCRSLRLNLNNPQPHSDECRDRIEAEIAKQEEGAENIRISMERMARQQKERDEREGGGSSKRQKSKHGSSASSSIASPPATCPVNKREIVKNESEEAKKRVRVEEPAREHKRGADELDENLMFDDEMRDDPDAINRKKI